MRRLATGTALAIALLPVLALPVAAHASVTAHPVRTAQQTLALGSFAAPAAGVRSAVGRESASTAHTAGRTTRSLYVRRDITNAFSAVAATWRSDPSLGDVTLMVRARQGSTWTSWRTGEDDAGHSAQGRETRSGSGLVWLGASEGVDAQLIGEDGKAPSDVQIQLIDPGASAADASPKASPAQAPGAAVVGRPTIYSRAQWGADERLMTWTPQYSATIKAGFVHHTVQANNYSPADVPAMIRADYQYHAVTRGWGDIGYNFLIDYFGRIWQGRAGDINRPGVGAHTGGFNTDTFGIAIMGDTTSHAIGSAVTAGISRTFAWKLAQYGRDPLGSTQLTSTGGGTSRYPAGTVVTKPVIMGHRDVGLTACPGTYAYPTLPGIRTTVATLMAPLIISPAVSTNSPVYGGAPLVMSAILRKSTGVRVEVFDYCTKALRVGWTSSWSLRDLSWRGNWNLRDSTGQQVGPGQYRMRFTAISGAKTSTWDTTVTVLGTAGTAPPSGTAAPRPRSAGTFFPISPTRLVNTRSGFGTTGVAKLAASASLRTPVAGHAGVPASGVTAVLLTLTATCATENTWLTVAPSDGVVPSTAPVVSTPNSVRSNTVTVPLGPDGAVIIRNARGFVDVEADVSGYYSTASTGGRFHPVTPALLYNAQALGQPLMAGERRIVPVAGKAGVPSVATAVAVELTGLVSIYGGSMVLYPAGGAVMSGSTAEFAPSDVFRTQAVVQISGGAIGMVSRANFVYPIVHVVGYYAPTTVAGGLRYVSLDPTSVFDTVSSGGPISSGSPRAVTFAGLYGVPSAGAGAVAISLRSFSSTTAAWLRAYPTGTAAPTYGVLWNEPGVQYSGSAWPALGAGSVTFGPTTGSSQVRADLSGYFTS